MGKLLGNDLAGPDEDQDLDGADVLVNLVDDVQEPANDVRVLKPPLGVSDDVEVLLVLGVVPIDLNQGVVDLKLVAVLRVRTGSPILDELVQRNQPERGIEDPRAIRELLQRIAELDEETVLLVGHEVDATRQAA